MRGSGERLNIGLLLTYNEVDVIAETLAANTPGVDAVFALDGSDDGTYDVLASHPKVVGLLRDEDVAGAGGRVRDHHRQALLDAARERFGFGHWYTLMHGDEVFHDDPRRVVALAERQGATVVNWAAMQFFLHVSDEGKDETGPVQERVTWYSPFWVEVRQFRCRPQAAYRVGEHGRVVPRGVGRRTLDRLPVLKHYPFRSREQAARRLGAMSDRGFSGSDVAAAEVYRERYEPRYRQVRRFDGSFHELEMDRQGPLLLNLLRWKLWT